MPCTPFRGPLCFRKRMNIIAARQPVTIRATLEPPPYAASALPEQAHAQHEREANHSGERQHVPRGAPGGRRYRSSRRCLRRARRCRFFWMKNKGGRRRLVEGRFVHRSVAILAQKISRHLQI